MNKKFIYSLVITILIFLCTAGVSAETKSGKCGDNVYWEFADRTLVISGNGEMWNFEDEIGDSNNSSPFQSAYENSDFFIINVIIEDGVTSIGNATFAHCKLLSNISIPDSIKRIGDLAFNDCPNLKTIDFPDNIVEIGRAAFANCGFTSIDYPDSMRYLSNDIFWGCEDLSYVSIPEGVQFIGNGAFSFCYNLNTIIIPNSVHTIDNEAFLMCKKLESISIPDGVTRIGDQAFYSCYGLKSITIPSSVTSIGSKAFIGPTDLVINGTYGSYAEKYANSNGITFKGTSDSNNRIDKNFSSETNQKKCGDGLFWTLNSGILRISGYGDMYDFGFISPTAYYMQSYNDFRDIDSNKVVQIIIEPGATSIGEFAFEYYKNLRYVSIPDTVTEIKENAFYNCINLTSVVLPNSVKTIGEDAFANCENLICINIPTSLTKIGDGIIYNCNKLESLYVPPSVTSIGDFAFHKPHLDIYGQPCSFVEEYAKDWGNTFRDINKYCGKELKWNVSEDILNITGFGSMINFNDYAPAPWSSQATTIKKINLPTGITCIGMLAFANFHSIQEANIPEGVELICDYAFYNCTNLDSITIPQGVTSIGTYAFSDCTSMQSIIIPNSVTFIGESAFYNCPNLNIYCENGSYAQKYATDNGIKFNTSKPSSNNQNNNSQSPSTASYTVTIPTFPVTVNGIRKDNTYAKYPYIVYNNITYFPMTYDDARFLGLSSNWTKETGLNITLSKTPSQGNGDTSTQSGGNFGKYTASRASGIIYVNGKRIYNAGEEYPLLVFRDVTYFPLTWRFAVTEFSWDYSFDTQNGLVINSK